ncbi:hypothetical protein M9H77_34628 [Catharanthus roseus]|uniref:Uncharacterized protein n=1 Tax=Catharanthus roseus TaxID=4058 RepID=A0ACB9ZNL2_CATRO|nr:hypothetical protein M9H77_34628 [Catharanthus roseus]
MVHFMDSNSLSGQDVLVIRANSDDLMKVATTLMICKAVSGRYVGLLSKRSLLISSHEGLINFRTSLQKYSFSRDDDDTSYEGFATRNNSDLLHEGFATRNDDDSSREGFAAKNNNESFHEGFATRNNDNSFHEGFANKHQLQKFSISENLDPPYLNSSCLTLL